MDEEVDVQPNGEHIEATLDVVPLIIHDAKFAEEVRVQNGFPEGLDQNQIALLFLTGRFHWAITILTKRTDTLDRLVDGLLRREEEEVPDHE